MAGWSQPPQQPFAPVEHAYIDGFVRARSAGAEPGQAHQAALSQAGGSGVRPEIVAYAGWFATATLNGFDHGRADAVAMSAREVASRGGTEQQVGEAATATARSLMSPPQGGQQPGYLGQAPPVAGYPAAPYAPTGHPAVPPPGLGSDPALPALIFAAVGLVLALLPLRYLGIITSVLAVVRSIQVLVGPRRSTLGYVALAVAVVALAISLVKAATFTYG